MAGPAARRAAVADDLFGDSDAASLPETWYAEAVRLDAEGSAAAVDAYLQAAVAAWPAVEMVAGAIQVNSPPTAPSISATVPDSREWELYQSAVGGLLVSAQKYGPLEPSDGTAGDGSARSFAGGIGLPWLRLGAD